MWHLGNGERLRGGEPSHSGLGDAQLRAGRREGERGGGVNESVAGAFAVSLLRCESGLSLTFWEIVEPLCTSVSL